MAIFFMVVGIAQICLGIIASDRLILERILLTIESRGDRT
jgi:hypothetical protein